MNQFHSELSQGVNKKTPVISMDGSGNSSTGLKRWLVAASIIVVIGLGSWLLLRPAAGERVYAAYYEKDPGLISAMGVSENYAFDKAMIDYKNGDYKKAITGWQELLPAHPLNDTLNYFIGSAWLASNDREKAIASFIKLLPLRNSVFYGEANWYLGLALAGQGKNREAITYLRRSGHANSEELIAKLK